MSGNVISIDGKIDCLARVALTAGGGKWEPGTILELYPLDHAHEWGDMAHFLIIRIELDEGQLSPARERKLIVPLESFLSEKSLDAYRLNAVLKKSDFLAIGEKPRLGIVVDGKSLCGPAPEGQWIITPEHPE